MITLSSPVSILGRLTPAHAEALKKLKIYTVNDLLMYFPNRYVDPSEIVYAGTLAKGQNVTMFGVLESVKVRRSFKGHMPMTEARISDNSGTLRLVWFNQAYIGKMYPDGSMVKVSGVVQEDTKGFLLSNPQIGFSDSVTPSVGAELFAKEGEERSATVFSPVYRETKGVSSQYIIHLVTRAFENGLFDLIVDPLPKHVVAALHLPSIREALLYSHFPKKEEQILIAKKRFAFQEIFIMQVMQAKERSLAKGSLSYEIKPSVSFMQSFLDKQKFVATNAQKNAIDLIVRDLGSGEPMGRLLEGDVGSGKTYVAAYISYLVTHTQDLSGKFLQVAFMAPTEILAKQHFEGLCKLFEGTPIEVGLLTSKSVQKFPSKANPKEATSVSKAQMKKWIEEGRVNMLIGTHALIQKSVDFAHLALVIIDEQHRFGVKQRKSLAHKKNDSRPEVPHLLSMTATPIPRTLALTIFGDLDLAVLDELPAGRKPIETVVVGEKGREKMYERFRGEIKSGRQVYVICPRIDAEDEEEKQTRSLKSVTEERDRLESAVFAGSKVGVLHGKMKQDEKDLVMQMFLQKEIDVLVATSVVEVGVNVPNATCICIEAADRFGLAQLHQLRGRVGRADFQSYCYLMTESTVSASLDRLKALANSRNGFELAELDMKTRGIGTLMEGKQWGMSDIAMEALKNPKLVEVAREQAKRLVEADPELREYPCLSDYIEGIGKVHME